MRDISSLFKEEKADAAYYSYIDMMKCCKDMESGLETKKYCFESLKEQKAYYTDLSENGGMITEGRGKFKFFSAKEDTVVSVKDIEEALSEVQVHINNYLIEPTEETDSLNIGEKFFQISAAVFSAATGITGSALTIYDDSFKKVKSGLTEGNYLERITDNINSIKGRSKQITDIMVDYASKNDLVKEKMKSPFKPAAESEKNPHLVKVLEEYRKYLLNNGLLI